MCGWDRRHPEARRAFGDARARRAMVIARWQLRVAWEDGPKVLLLPAMWRPQSSPCERPSPRRTLRLRAIKPFVPSIPDVSLFARSPWPSTSAPVRLPYYRTRPACPRKGTSGLFSPGSPGSTARATTAGVQASTSRLLSVTYTNPTVDR